MICIMSVDVVIPPVIGRSLQKRCCTLKCVAQVRYSPLTEAAQDGDGLGDGGRLHQDLLEAALQGGIPLDVLAVLRQCGGPDAPQLPTPQHGLQQVACAERSGLVTKSGCKPGRSPLCKTVYLPRCRS